MIRRPPRSTLDRSSAASDVYKRQDQLVAQIAAEPDFVSACDWVVDSDSRVEQLVVGVVVAQNLAVRRADDHGGVCLLYTSPSPRDRTRSRMPSSA